MTIPPTLPTRFLDPLPDALVVVDRRWRIVYGNAAFAAFAGRPAEALTGEVLWSAFPPFCDGEARRAIERAAGGTAVAFECGGPPSALRLSVRAAGSADGVAIACSRPVVRPGEDGDASERDERYRLLFDSSPRAMWVYDVATTRFLAVNAAAMTLYGYSREEFLAMTLADIRPAEEVAALREAVSTAPPGLFRSGAFRHRTRDGRVIDVDITSHSLTFDGYRARLVLVTDETVRRRAEAALAESERRLLTVIESIDQGLLLSDLTGRIEYANTRLSEITGYTANEVLGRLLFELQANPEERGAAEARHARRTSGERLRQEVELTRKDGTKVWVEIASVPFRDSSGNVTGGIATLTDVSERRLLQAEIIQAQKMEAVGRLAGGIAHDFNNVLTAITGNVELILSDPGLTAELRSEAEDVRRAAGRAAALTRQLLAFGRKQMLRPEVVDPNSLVIGLERMLRRLLVEDVVLRTELTDAPGAVRADAGQLEQVLVNLLVNAGDAMPDGGTVTIGTAVATLDEEFVRTHVGSVPGRYCAFTVTDTGHGMMPEVQMRAFEPFFTTKPPGKGTGLGLATVYGIVKQSGGYVDLRSAHGLGTTVTVYLPCIEPDPPLRAHDTLLPAATPSPIRHHSPSGAILLVDDDDNVRVAIGRVLRRLGYEVLIAANGTEALGIAADPMLPIGLVMIDLVMPGMSGVELAMRIKAVRGDVKVLLVSGHSDDQVSRFDVAARTYPFIQKPFSVEMLAAQLRELLGTPNPR
ncbi:MAG: PAS domain-containing sensor histidine kinase [Gemmatimonadaceae bacterium]